MIPYRSSPEKYCGLSFVNQGMLPTWLVRTLTRDKRDELNAQARIRKHHDPSKKQPVLYFLKATFKRYYDVFVDIQRSPTAIHNPADIMVQFRKPGDTKHKVHLCVMINKAQHRWVQGNDEQLLPSRILEVEMLRKAKWKVIMVEEEKLAELGVRDKGVE